MEQKWSSKDDRCRREAGRAPVRLHCKTVAAKAGDPLRGRIPYFGASKSFDLDSGR
jgi:hypothetical protein